MQLNKEQILTESLAWSTWLDAHMPLAMLDNMEPRLQGLLIDTLRHFKETRGASTSVYGEGALVVVDSDKNLIEQLQQLLSFNIRRIMMKTSLAENPSGHQRLTIAHLDFITCSTSPATGLQNSAALKKIWQACKKLVPEIQEIEVQNMVEFVDRVFLEEAATALVAQTIVLLWRSQKDVNVIAEHQSEGDRNGALCIALANRKTSPTGFFYNLLRVIRSFGFSLQGVQSLYVRKDNYDETLLSHFYLVPPPESNDIKSETQIGRLLEAMAVTQWFEFEHPFNQQFVYELGFSIHHCILLRSIEEFIFQMLVHVDANLYSLDSIHEAFTRHPDISRQLVKNFTARFNPVHSVSHLQSEDQYRQVLDMVDRLDSGIPVNDERRRTILQLGAEFIAHVLKTNYYVLRHPALSFRLDPHIMDKVNFPRREELFPELPHAIFFVKGKNFFAFNLRFRDLARGGVRTLLPLDREKQDHQQKEVFRECYQLAYTQQKKNKDIPEGGAKSVIFVKNYFGFERDMAAEKNLLGKKIHSQESLSKALEDSRHTRIRRQLFDAQRSFCEALLDILIWDEQKQRLANPIIHDDLAKEELVFLGPDENMLDPMIEWISARSKERGYRIGKAFMSGKKDEGINHKAYGVTSLGVHEYLKAALQSRGLHGQNFSVKMAGGPDGDVAGNELMNLVKDFGKKVKILGIIDGTGLLLDPQGINQTEIKRLFKMGLGVGEFNPQKLGDGASLLLIHHSREKSAGVKELLRLKNNGKGKGIIEEEWLGASQANRIYSQDLLKLESDVFLPCGGRPRTLNEKNWKNFLNAQGQPSSPIIVEGANLFFDEAARIQLEAHGCLIIKDASANKCGVICSSYEIMAGLLLSGEEFTRVKAELVPQVLTKLMIKAGNEARLLVDPSVKSTIAMSDEISRAINHWTDAIMEDLTQMGPGAEFEKLFKAVVAAAVPTILVQKAPKKLAQLPLLYRHALVAATLASALIYRYGIGYHPSLVASLKLEVDRGLLGPS
jgi:glutamate dehydrogenase